MYRAALTRGMPRSPRGPAREGQGGGPESDETVAAQAGRVWLSPGERDVTGHVRREPDLVAVDEPDVAARVHALTVDEGPVGRSLVADHGPAAVIDHDRRVPPRHVVVLAERGGDQGLRRVPAKDDGRSRGNVDVPRGEGDPQHDQGRATPCTGQGLPALETDDVGGALHGRPAMRADRPAVARPDVLLRHRR